jgi:putative nucleotidyltransferase with HDIG domain
MSTDEMRPISIDDAIAKTTLEVDLFVKLSDVKFVMVAKAGTATPSEHLAKFKAKNVKYLWVRGNDYSQVAKHSVTVAGLVVGAARIADASKLAVLSDATSAVFREAESCGFSESTFTHSKIVVEATLQLAANQPTLSSLIEKISAMAPDAARHAMAVSLLASMIGTGHDWVKSATLEKLALGGMLHDIGKLMLPKDLLEKKPHFLTKDERTILRSHPELGREMLSRARNVPEDVVLIVAEHHELADGSGFPRGLKDFQISPLARVVALANAFAGLLAESRDKSGISAFREIEATRPGHFNRDAMKALRRMVERDTFKAA